MRRYAVVVEECRARDREYASFLDELIKERPRVLALRREQEELNKERLRLEEQIAAEVKTLKETITEAGYQCQFQDPRRDEISGVKLFQLYPEARNIPDLWWPEINAEVFKAAVAAGKIPIAVADLVSTRVPTTKAGRSVLTRVDR